MNNTKHVQHIGVALICAGVWLNCHAQGTMTLDNLTVTTNTALRGPVIVGEGGMPSNAKKLYVTGSLDGSPNVSGLSWINAIYTGNSGYLNYYGLRTTFQINPAADVYDLASSGAENMVYRYGTNNINATDLFPLRGTQSRVGIEGGGTVSGIASYTSFSGVEGYAGNPTVTRLAHFYANSPYRGAGSGTIGTAYGLYLNEQKKSFVGTAYGIYQIGTNDINYLNGSVGIGTSSPAEKVHVSNGNVKVSNGQFIGNGSGLLITAQGDLSMGTFTAGQQP